MKIIHTIIQIAEMQRARANPIKEAHRRIYYN